MTNYSKIWPGSMSFEHEVIGGKTIDFDKIYDEIFEPTIKAMPLPAPESGIDHPDLQ